MINVLGSSMMNPDGHGWRHSGADRQSPLLPKKCLQNLGTVMKLHVSDGAEGAVEGSRHQPGLHGGGQCSADHPQPPAAPGGSAGGWGWRGKPPDEFTLTLLLVKSSCC